MRHIKTSLYKVRFYGPLYDINKKMTIFLMRDPFLLASILTIRYTSLVYLKKGDKYEKKSVCRFFRKLPYLF